MSILQANHLEHLFAFLEQTPSNLVMQELFTDLDWFKGWQTFSLIATLYTLFYQGQLYYDIFVTGYKDIYYEWTQLEAAALGIQFVLSLPYTYAMFNNDLNEVTNSLFLQIWNAFDLCIALYFAVNFIYMDPAPLNIAY